MRHSDRVIIALFGATFLIALITDAAVTAVLQNGPDSIVRLGSGLSWMGNSAWMAIGLVLCSVAAALTSKYSDEPLTRATAHMLLMVSVLLFTTILLSGIGAQILKHAIGRARPLLFQELGAFAFTPLAIEPIWHSFPSGHATTVGAVAMVGVRVLRQYARWFIGFAIVAGVARIASGVHYPSDVIAGYALGGWISAALLRFLAQRKIIPNPESPRWTAAWHMLGRWLIAKTGTSSRKDARGELAHLRRTVLLLLAMFATLIGFISFPEIDLVVSGLFYDPERGFWLGNSPELDVARHAFALVIFVVFLVALVLWIHAVRAPEHAMINGDVWGFVVCALAIGPGLIANSLFKTYWGRARPAHIKEFGGDAQFTLPFELAQECLRNCSFVSGEGSGIAMLALVILSLGWPHLRKAPIRLASPVMTIAAFGIALRVVKGRHFLSDTVFAVLLMGMVLILLYRVFEIERRRTELSGSAVWADLAMSARYFVRIKGPDPSLCRDLVCLCNALIHVLAVFRKVLQETAAASVAAIKFA